MLVCRIELGGSASGCVVVLVVGQDLVLGLAQFAESLERCDLAAVHFTMGLRRCMVR